MHSDEATAYEHRFLSLYAAVSDPCTVAEALNTPALRARAALALKTTPEVLQEALANETSRGKLSRSLRARPDLVARLELPDAKPVVAGSYLMHALDSIPEEAPPSEAAAGALARMGEEFAAKYLRLTGEELKVEIGALAKNGRAALVHLLHTSPRFPTFGTMFANRERLSAARPTVASSHTKSPTNVPPRADARRPAVPARREGADSAKDGDDARRDAEIEVVLERCARAPATSSGREHDFPEEIHDREDIYYDFSIVIPIDGAEDESGREFENDLEQQLQASSIAAFSSLLSAARSVVATLEQAKLKEIFGPTLISDVEKFLDSAAQNIGDRRSSVREGLRRVARELAAALRLIARVRLSIAPGESDLMKEAEKLAKTLKDTGDNFSFSLQEKVRLPKQMGANAYGEYSPHGTWIYEHGADTGMPAGSSQVLWANGVQQFPNAEWLVFAKYHYNGAQTVERWFTWSYGWDQIDELRGYLAGMVAKFPELISMRDLLWEASKMLAAIKGEIASGAVGDSEYRKRMQQVLNGLVNDSAYSLATILEEVAELIEIPLPHRQRDVWVGRRLPYSKRLALQIVYRQTWSPAGYSKGKMVGYKTLLPGETQQVKRRTFVKTTSETTAVEDFSASRQNDYSSTQRETSDILRETGDKFDFRASASGHVDFAVAGAEVKAETGVALAGTSRSVRNSISESVSKGAVSYSNKREVKVRELVETEVTDESVVSIANANQEITANYFYYQLFRNYKVSTILYDVRPVLLVGRDYPTPAQIDEVWLGKHMHDILFALPPQLAADATSAVNTLDGKSRRLVRTRSAATRAQAEYELLRDAMLPSTANPTANSAALDDRQREALARAAAAATEAREALATAESDYLEANTRVSRVVSHVRENILMYMHRIWQAGSDIDRQNALRGETFFNVPLDRLTRGLNRLGYLGSEEVYEYTQRSAIVLDALMEFSISGAQVMGLPDGTPLKEQLIRRYEIERALSRQEAIKLIQKNIVVTDEDPQGAADIPRDVQVAQDAVVVEAMPGSTPLLEGFKLAHRALDVQRACLENQHLAARIVDRPWKNPKSRDDYSVARGDTDGVESRTGGS